MFIPLAMTLLGYDMIDVTIKVGSELKHKSKSLMGSKCPFGFQRSCGRRRLLLT
jgi:hypothetical protein